MRPNRFYLLALAVLAISGGKQLFATEPDDELFRVFSARKCDDTADELFRQPRPVIFASQADETDVEAPPIDAEGVPEGVDDVGMYSTMPGGWMDNPYLIINPVGEYSILATRFGWWGVNRSGSRSMVGEWQGLDTSSPFFDVDGLFSNGYRTADFYVTGTENESTLAGLHFYNGPGLTADLDYRRFIHRPGHDPIGGPAMANGFPPPGGFYDPPLPGASPGAVMYGEDFNPGEDYAIRVQQLQANFKGRLSENFRWRLNVWGMKKEGTRQANSQQHCFSLTPPPGTRTCHVVSQGQHIDWLTMEVEPVIEGRFGWLTVEYSRTMRSFEENDELVLNNFTSVSPTYGFQAVGAYGLVPENYTEIDRVKLHGQLGACTDMYVVSHVGNTHNKFRDSDRKFYGVDARLTNNSIEGLTMVAYGKTHVQNNSADTAALNDRYPANPYLLEAVPPQQIYNPANNYLGLVDREYNTVGVKSRWRPFYRTMGTMSRLAVTSGYEYKQIERDNVTYDLDRLTPFFTQPTTNTHMFNVGLQQYWSRQLQSYVRYKWIDTDYPLVGITERQQLSLDAAINSNLPAHEDRIEIGTTWSPTDNFMVNGSFWIQNSYNHTEYVNFEEDSYPLVVSAWYAPNECWSFTGGYATFTNWINQDITLGREDGSSGAELPAWTTPWRFTGRTDVINLAATYLYSYRLRLNGGFEYVRAENFFEEPLAPATANPDYGDLPGYSAVVSNIYRFNAGFDYDLTDAFTTYVRYNYYDFYDPTFGGEFNSGATHMFLGGLTGTF